MWISDDGWRGTLTRIAFYALFYATYQWIGFEDFIAVMAIFVLIALYENDTDTTQDQEIDSEEDDPRSESWDDLPDGLKEHGNEGIR